MVFLTGCTVSQIQKVPADSSQSLKQEAIVHCACGGTYQLRENSIDAVKIEKEQACTSHPWGTDLVLCFTKTSLYACDTCGKVYEKTVSQEKIECHGFDGANIE